MIGIDTLVTTVVFLLIAGLILGLLWWLIGYVEAQGLGPPVMFKVIRVVFVILVVLVLISVLLGLAGHPVIRWSSIKPPFSPVGAAGLFARRGVFPRRTRP